MYINKINKLLKLIENSINQNIPKKNIKYTNFNFLLIKVLIKEGIITNYILNNNIITILFPLLNSINYTSPNNLNKSLINLKIEQISKESKKIYSKSKYLSNINDNDIYLISTSKGLMTNKDSYLNNIGGEILCKIIYKKCLI